MSAAAKPHAGPAVATVQRTTKETTIEVHLELDGAGAYDVETDNKFLTHMMETLTRYAGWDLKLRATGDLDHHLIEDVAIAMGQAFRQAHDGAPCARMSFDQVCMDDCLMACTVDLVDRPYYEGPLPIPIYDHWFRSFAMEARINLHLEHKRGRDTHHAAEAAFKTFGRAVRRARDPRADEVSTKGTVQASS